MASFQTRARQVEAHTRRHHTRLRPDCRPRDKPSWSGCLGACHRPGRALWMLRHMAYSNSKVSWSEAGIEASMSAGEASSDH